MLMREKARWSTFNLEAFWIRCCVPAVPKPLEIPGNVLNTSKPWARISGCLNLMPQSLKTLGWYARLSPGTPCCADPSTNYILNIDQKHVIMLLSHRPKHNTFQGYKIRGKTALFNLILSPKLPLVAKKAEGVWCPESFYSLLSDHVAWTQLTCRTLLCIQTCCQQKTNHHPTWHAVNHMG